MFEDSSALRMAAIRNRVLVGVVALAMGITFMTAARASASAFTTWTSPTSTAYSTPDISEGGQVSEEPKVAISGSTAIATWYRWNGTQYIVQAAASADGGVTWGAVTSLSAAGQDARAPEVAISGTTAIVTWYRNNGSHNIVQVVRSIDGGATWGAVTSLSAAGANVNRPQVAIDGSTAIVAWSRYNGANWIAQAARSSDSGATWGSPVDLSTAGSDVNNIAVGMSGTNAVVAWPRWNGSNLIIQAAASANAGTSWATPVNVSLTLQSADFVQVALSGSVGVITWQRSDGSNTIVQAANSSDGGATWGTPVSLSTAGANATDPQVAVSGSSAVITWVRNDGANTIVQSAQSTDGGVVWGAFHDLSAPGRNAEDPQVALLGSSALITWDRSNGSSTIVQVVSSTDAGATWGSTTDLSATGRSALAPQVAQSAGVAVAVWVRTNSSYPALLT